MKQYFECTIGAIMFSVGINMILSPLGLYNGGFVGIGQLGSYVLKTFFHLTFRSINVSGILYFLLNVPLFILAYRSMSRSFFRRTVYTVVLQMALLVLIPIRATPFAKDFLTACIVGGLVSGFGTGIILRAGGSGGGQDILGVYFSKRFPDFTVGKINLIINGFVYGGCALLFDVSVVVYSLIYTFVMSFIIDKVHTQNVNNTILIFSKKDGLDAFVIREVNRGVTLWDGRGGYTQDRVNIAIVALSEYELPAVRKKLAEFDKDAFVVVSRNNSIYGNFERRLDA